MDAEKVAAWVAILAAVFAVLKVATHYWSSALTPEEKEVLYACGKNGELRILNVDGWGEWVRADTKDFFDGKDPAHAARYLEAFHRLVGRGLAKHEDGFLYRLTGSGFKIARSVVEKRQNA